MRITYTPTLLEHLRARRALREVAPMFDAQAMLPWLLAVSLIGNLLNQAASPEGSLWVMAGQMFGGAACFFAGIGIRARKDAGKPLVIELGAEGIEIRQPRHRWSVPWARVQRVDETAEFFLVAAGRAAFYLPKRALGGAAGERALREMLNARRP
jgi:hypothetical protein